MVTYTITGEIEIGEDYFDEIEIEVEIESTKSRRLFSPETRWEPGEDSIEIHAIRAECFVNGVLYTYDGPAHTWNMPEKVWAELESEEYERATTRPDRD